MAGSSKPTSIVPGGVGEPAAHDDVEMASATSPQAHSQSGASLPENGKSDETDGENDEAGPSSATLPPPSPRTQRRQQPQFDDPDLLASYPIYLSTSLPVSSKLHLMQYPTYPRKQPLPVPESSRQRGLSQAIRWRPNAGWVQVELPLDLRRSVYDDERGADMGRGALMAGGEIGSTTPADGDDDDDRKKKKKKPKREDDDGDLASKETKRLEKIRLESDLIPNMTRYCVGVMRDREYDIGVAEPPRFMLNATTLYHACLPSLPLHRGITFDTPRPRRPATSLDAPPGWHGRYRGSRETPSSQVGRRRRRIGR